LHTEVGRKEEKWFRVKMKLKENFIENVMPLDTRRILRTFSSQKNKNGAC
jgi:hypothetical protein